MCNTRLFRTPIACCLAAAFLSSASAGQPSGQELLTAAGKPAEGPLDVFLGEPLFDMQVVFDGGNDVREPYLAIAVDGTLLAVRNYQTAASPQRGRRDGAGAILSTCPSPIQIAT
ncbi:MAG: hypothetical protein ACOX1P_19050 [Thermoguttaceae bacterium]